jgi:predicted lactoylglutathione lyase
MISSIFINMPVADVSRTTEFFRALGFSINDRFTGADSVCVQIGPNISTMMMNGEKFKAFIDKEVASKASSEVILSLSCESAEVVRSIAEKAFALGARKVNEAEDTDFMFSWAFEDLEGHLWDLFWLKENSAQ